MLGRNNKITFRYELRSLLITVSGEKKKSIPLYNTKVKIDKVDDTIFWNS